MKVKELIDILKNVNPEFEVFLSKDEEGNCFSPLDCFSMGLYESECTWQGEFTSYADEDNEIELTEEESNSICLWPTN